jgi:hypothetical protein
VPVVTKIFVQSGGTPCEGSAPAAAKLKLSAHSYRRNIDAPLISQENAKEHHFPESPF